MNDGFKNITLACRQLGRELIRAGFRPGDVGLALTNAEARTRLLSVAALDDELARSATFKAPGAPTSIHGFPVFDTYRRQSVDQEAVLQWIERTASLEQLTEVAFTILDRVRAISPHKKGTGR